MAFAGRVLWLCVLALVLGGATGKSTNLHQLVDRMRSASGEPYRYHLTSSARELLDGADVQLQTDFLGLQFVSRACDATVCSGTYFDGSRLFAVNMNDTALPASGGTERFVRAMRIINSGAFLAPDFERSGGKVSDLGTIRSGGKSYRALGVNGADAQPMVIWVDPATYLVSAVHDWTGEVAFEDRDYRRVGPLMLPFAIYQGGRVVQQYATRDIVSTPFERPHGLAVAFETTPTAIPIVKAGNAPVIPCIVAQVARRCLIDTGNSGLSLSVELAEDLHLSSIGEFEVRGLGRYATEVVRTGPLTVGSAHFPAANYVVLHDIHQYGYDIVLGADVLANSVVTIDYAGHSVTFSDRPDAQPASRIALAFINFVPVVPVQLGSTAALLAVDTGDDSTINLSYDYYREHSDLFAATEARTVDGVGGSSEQLLGEIALVRLGDFRVESQQIGTTRTLHATGQGHLGAGFLSHFRVVLEYARARIGLTPRSGDKSVESQGPPLRP